jgi:hypothetical protein
MGIGALLDRRSRSEMPYAGTAAGWDKGYNAVQDGFGALFLTLPPVDCAARHKRDRRRR